LVVEGEELLEFFGVDDFPGHRACVDGG
jgi:hypothetical protein